MKFVRFLQIFNLAQRFRKPGRQDVFLFVVLWLITVLVAVGTIFMFPESAHALPLSAGDRVNVTIQSGEEFNGKYQVNLDGALELPYTGNIIVSGMELREAENVVAGKLVDKGLFNPKYVHVTLQVLDWSAIEVSVQGAVYSPGHVRVNMPSAKSRLPDNQQQLPGAELPERSLSDALRAAGGVTTDADLRHIVLTRHGVTQEIDISGMLDGTQSNDLALISGDAVLVPSVHVVQPELARPSRITPPGIKVLVSNLTSEGKNNAGAGLSAGSIALPYGSRFSQAVVAANCAGGAQFTNAGRNAVLVRTERISGKSVSWKSSMSDLFQNSNNSANPNTNPILLEGDGIVCYDSAITGVRDIFRTITDILFPFTLERLLR